MSITITGGGTPDLIKAIDNHRLALERMNSFVFETKFEPILPLSLLPVDYDSPAAVQQVAEEMAKYFQTLHLPLTGKDAIYFVIDVAAAFTTEALKTIEA